jgi:Glycosyl hydrolases family 28
MKYKIIKIFYRIFISLTMSTLLYAQGRDYNIITFGARADGVTNNAIEIQKAIDEASMSGGGRVIIPAGNFVSGTIYLKSDVDFYLDKGARLLGSIKRKDYDNKVALALIVAKDQRNISISGEGIIDGQAPQLIEDIFRELNNHTLSDPQWEFKRPTENIRPMLIDFINCEKVTLSRVTLENSSCWVQRYDKCNNLFIDKIKVESTAYWNNDGLDIVDSKNIRVQNCYINSSDDGICLKSDDPNDFCDSIFVSDCTIRSSASAFKIGTGSKGGFKDISVRNLKIFDTYRSAIAIECVDGGTLENVDVDNINAENVGDAIFIRLGNRNEKGDAGILRGVRIADLKALIPLRKPDLGYPFEGPPDYLRYQYNKSSKERPNLEHPFIGQPDYPYNLIPSSIVGISGHYIEDITLENIEIIFYGGGNKKVAQIKLDELNKVPEKISDYPEFSMFGELPAWGFYVRHVAGIKMKNIKLSYEKYDFRPAMVFDDVKEVYLEGIQIPTGKELPIILFNNANNKTLKNIKLPVEVNAGIKNEISNN